MNDPFLIISIKLKVLVTLTNLTVQYLKKEDIKKRIVEFVKAQKKLQ